MSTYLLHVLTKYKKKGLLIDTNLLLLYIVGSVDPASASRHGRTAMYSVDDFDRVSKFIEAFETKVTTPHILTELTDLFGNRSELNHAAAAYIKTSMEWMTDSKRLCETTAFKIFGLADSAVVAAAKGSYLVLTDDKELYGFLASQMIDVVSLEQIRAIGTVSTSVPSGLPR